MRAVCVLATMSHYPSPIIGEPIQTLPIYPPAHEESASYVQRPREDCYGNRI